MSRPEHPVPVSSAPTLPPLPGNLYTRDTAWLAKARRFWSQSNWEEALRAFDQAVAAEPGNVRALVDAARACGARYQYEKAGHLLSRLLALAPDHPVLLIHAGHSYRLIHRFAEAAHCFERALALCQGQSQVELELAKLFERLHRLEDAQILIDRVLEAQPRWPAAQLVSAKIRRRLKLESQAESSLRHLLAQPVTDPDLFAEAWAELAQLLDHRGDYDGAMEAIVLSKQLLLPRDKPERQTAEFVLGRFQLLYDSLEANDLQRWLELSASLVDHPPLALLAGFPRTGTTLLEQCLDAHPQAASSEERDIMGFEIFPALVHSVADRASLRDVLDRASLEVLRPLQARYFQYNASWIGQPLNGRLLLDKNPGAALLLPVFLRMFPRFKTLLALRDPRDVLLSCFMLYLPLNPLSVNFLTLDRLARRFAQDMNGWLKLRQSFPLPWLEVRYEDTVADLPAQARRVLDFLGLPWDPAVLRFQDRARQRPVLSPTYAAVTQPIHNRAIGRWRHYADYIEPVLPILEPLVKALGYAAA